MTLFNLTSITCPTESTHNYPRAHSPQWRSVTAEVCHSSHPSAGDIRVTFSPPLWHSWRFLFCFYFFFKHLTPYLAEMKKSKQNQLTGGEKTLGENVTQPPLRHQGPRETTAGYDAGFGNGPAAEVARCVITAGLVVVRVGPQVGVSREEGKGAPVELRSSLGQQKRSPLPEAPQTTAWGLHASLGNINLVLTSSAVMFMSSLSISVVCGKAACVCNYPTGASDQAADKASY